MSYSVSCRQLRRLSHYSVKSITSIPVLPSLPNLTIGECHVSPLQSVSCHKFLGPMQLQITSSRYSNNTSGSLETSAVCWKCQSEINYEVNLFPIRCSKCGYLQKLGSSQIPNYFSLLGQPISYNVDLGILSIEMKKLQKQLHPDLFSNASKEQQELSQSLSSLVNEAIVTLQNPILRGLYLLRLSGISIDIEKEQTLDPGFLSLVLELNEQLEEVKTAHEWEAFRSQNRKAFQALQKALGKAFEDKNLMEAQKTLFKMKYYENLELKLKDLQSKFNIVD